MGLTATTVSKVQTFINKCSKRTINIHWPDTISNEELWRRSKQSTAEEEIGYRRLRWLGHTLRKAENNVTRQVLQWSPRVKTKRGQPRKTWRRDLQADMRRIGYAWDKIVTSAQDREPVGPL